MADTQDISREPYIGENNLPQKISQQRKRTFQPTDFSAGQDITLGKNQQHNAAKY
jgi:hypothetical protein